MVEDRLAGTWDPNQWREVTVVLAVSGGADSVALVRAMCSIKKGGAGRLLVAHLNHRLRAQESDADQAFVEGLCRKLGMPCEVESLAAGQLAAARPEGLEAAARAARYEFLQRVAGRVGARYVATAHTADDQAETILHRIVRGTGISGLSGMARARTLGPATLIRPLLSFRRGQLLEYLSDLGQPYRSDPSNEDLRFTRNRIRHRLLPQLAEEFNTAVTDALLRLGQLAGEVQEVVGGLVEDCYRQAVRGEREKRVRIEAALVRPLAPYLVRELLIAVWRRQDWPLQAMGYAQWDLLAEMLRSAGRSNAPPRRQMFPGAIVAEVRDGSLHLERTGFSPLRGNEFGQTSVD
jgi:tRNA(Ile)-lysidine synthase